MPLVQPQERPQFVGAGPISKQGQLGQDFWHPRHERGCRWDCLPRRKTPCIAGAGVFGIGLAPKVFQAGDSSSLAGSRDIRYRAHSAMLTRVYRSVPAHAILSQLAYRPLSCLWDRRARWNCRPSPHRKDVAGLQIRANTDKQLLAWNKCKKMPSTQH